VNNAGIAGDQAAQVAGHVDLDVVRQVFATNVFGVIAVTEVMIPLLRRSPRGRIVNVSSSVGSLTRMSDPGHYFADMPGLLAYPASKTALNQVTLQYAKALRSDGILVNAADPGPCRTDFTKGIPGVERTAADGARVICELATLGDGAGTGSYRRDTGPVPW
jgi:NAD(P)-dependent dehydrogenase (short-subunit alcohol dehydrogenase family)